MENCFWMLKETCWDWSGTEICCCRNSRSCSPWSFCSDIGTFGSTVGKSSWGAEKGNHEDDDPFDPEPVDPEAAPDLYPPDPCDIWGKIKQQAAKERDTDILQNLRAFPVIYEANHQPDGRVCSFLLSNSWLKHLQLCMSVPKHVFLVGRRDMYAMNVQIEIKVKNKGTPKVQERVPSAERVDILLINANLILIRKDSQFREMGSGARRGAACRHKQHPFNKQGPSLKSICKNKWQCWNWSGHSRISNLRNTWSKSGSHGCVGTVRGQ